MNFKCNMFIIAIFPLLIYQSVLGQYGGMDTTKIGIKEGDEFTYSIVNFDVIGQFRSIYDNPLLYMGIDYSGVSEFTLKVFLISVPVDHPDAYCLYVLFNATLSENNIVTIESCLDIFGEMVIFTQWDYWEEYIESKPLRYPGILKIGNNFEYEEGPIKYEFDEDSSTYSRWGYSNSESFTKVQYNRESGMAIYLERKRWYYFSNGSKEGYHETIIEGNTDIDRSDNPAFLVGSKIYLVGIIIIPLCRISKRKIQY